MNNSYSIFQSIEQKARSLGFPLNGSSSTTPEKDSEFYHWWIEQGFGEGMPYLARQEEQKKAFTKLMPSAKSALVLARPFPGNKESLQQSSDSQNGFGKIARYAALTEDYHHTLGKDLRTLCTEIDQIAKAEGIAIFHPSQGFVDGAALPERSLARAAGLGWIGKNAMLIHPEYGSWFWLGVILTEIPLPASTPIADHCGNCRRCIDACPTNAILEDKRAIDARLCLSYWNIEYRGEIPEKFHQPMGDWLLGCDICQEVCPWNSHSLKKARLDIGAPEVEWLPLEIWEKMSAKEFKEKFGHRAIERARRAGMIRNAEIVRKNQKKD